MTQPKAPAPQPTVAPNPEAHGSLETMTLRQCRYVMNDPLTEAVAYCGRETRSPKDAYCEQHYNECYREAPAKTRAPRARAWTDDRPPTPDADDG